MVARGHISGAVRQRRSEARRDGTRAARQHGSAWPGAGASQHVRGAAPVLVAGSASPWPDLLWACSVRHGWLGGEHAGRGRRHEA